MYYNDWFNLELELSQDMKKAVCYFLLPTLLFNLAAAAVLTPDSSGFESSH